MNVIWKQMTPRARYSDCVRHVFSYRVDFARRCMFVREALGILNESRLEDCRGNHVCQCPLEGRPLPLAKALGKMRSSESRVKPYLRPRDNQETSHDFGKQPCGHVCHLCCGYEHLTCIPFVYWTDRIPHFPSWTKGPLGRPF